MNVMTKRFHAHACHASLSVEALRRVTRAVARGESIERAAKVANPLMATAMELDFAFTKVGSSATGLKGALSRLSTTFAEKRAANRSRGRNKRFHATARVWP
jgi:hypothetical protein